ncbi:MAG: hypothetical protein NUV32_09355 [Exilispira sp.]|jgi:hypothetical protein|nr:hypothetical protein [Exilispira sp.]
MEKNDIIIKHYISYKRKNIRLIILIIVLGIFIPLSFFKIYITYDFWKGYSNVKILHEMIKSFKIIVIYILPFCIVLFLIFYIPIHLILKSIIKEIKDIDF